MRNVVAVLAATENKNISRAKLRKIAELSPEEQNSAWQLLVSDGTVTEREVFEAYAKIRSLPFVDGRNIELDNEVVMNTLSPTFCRKQRVIPLSVDGDSIAIGMDTPENFAAIDEISATTRFNPYVHILTPTAVDELINRYFRTDDEIDKLAESFESEEVGDQYAEEIAGGDTDESEPVVRFVSLLIAQAIQDRVSDIHIEPSKNSIRVRYRIDGVLKEFRHADKSIQSGVISRLKVMADMDIAVKRKPQDGRMSVRHSGKIYDLRATSLPTVWGEKIVLRILDNSTDKSTIETIGMSKHNQEVFMDAVSRSQGMVLVTGPTGSGKSTTLYTTLKHIADPSVSVVTVEDPVEKRIPGIDQIQINESSGSSFSNVLRSILRADPDIVFVGEIRDEETAEIAIKASMTGHLVLSTLHTNGAAESVSRIVEMGIAPYLVVGSVSCVVAQRLARRLCDQCKVPMNKTEIEEVYSNDFPAEETDTLYKPVGCNSCSSTGYRGRIALTEVMKIDENLDQLIVDRASSALIREEAEKHGFKPLREDGWEKVRAGHTSVKEIYRVT